MKIISFCDKRAYEPYKYLIKSAEKHDFLSKYEFILYTVGFKVEDPHPKVLYKEFPCTLALTNPEHTRRIKPQILLQSLEDFQDEDMLYIDTDHLLGKRFNPKLLLNRTKSLLIPLAGYHCCNLDQGWKNSLLAKINTTLSTSYNFDYTQTNIVLYNLESRSFLLKWKKLCLDETYTKNLSFFNYAAGDEIVYNSILGMTNSNLNLGQIHINIQVKGTYHFDVVDFSERMENHFNNKGIPECRILNTSTIMFYHGGKNPEQLKTYFN
jgi:hypothetical protein